MPTGEFEKKFTGGHLWFVVFGRCRCLVGGGSICNLLVLNLQMPGRGWKHLQFAGIGLVDAWSGLEASAICWYWSCRCLVRVGSICNLLDMNLQMPVLGLEASAICWIWICRCLTGFGSICNLLDLDLQMPGRVRKHLQFAGIGFVDAWSGLEVSAICWNWICRCLSWGWKHLQFAGIGFADAYPGFGSICNLLVLNLQMPGRNRKYLQFAGIGLVDAYHQVDIKNPTTIAEGLFFMSKKSKMFL